MQIGVPKETADGERRVALVPEVVRKLLGREGGLEVVVERGAGAGALIPDASTRRRARGWSRTRGAVYEADVVVKVAPPNAEEIGAAAVRQRC